MKNATVSQVYHFVCIWARPVKVLHEVAFMMQFYVSKFEINRFIFYGKILYSWKLKFGTLNKIMPSFKAISRHLCVFLAHNFGYNAMISINDILTLNLPGEGLLGPPPIHFRK